MAFKLQISPFCISMSLYKYKRMITTTESMHNQQRLYVLFFAFHAGLATNMGVASGSVPDPVYSLPPTTKLAYPADNYAQLLTTPISIQAETNGGFSILGKFFLASSTTYPWRLYQMRNFDLAVSGALDIQFQLYQMSASANYEVQFRNMRSSDTCHFSFPRLTEENSWYSIAVKYSTVDDSFELRFNNVIVLQGSCVSGNLENFELNRVLVQEQNWAGLRLYDSLLTDAEVASELNKICVPADTCADVLTAGCDTAPTCPLTCPDNTYASSGAVLAFNPTAASETFGDNIARETSAFHTNLGPRTFNIAENGGFTAVFKVNFGSSMGVYESVFAFADGDAGSGVKTNAIHCQGSYQTSNSYFSCKIYDQATVQCKIDGHAGTVTPNTDHSVVFRYDLASNQLYLKTDNSVKTQACSSAPQHSRTLPNTLLGRTWSAGSAQLNGKIFGLYTFDRALTDAESQQVLDGIVIGASDSPPQWECTLCPTDGTVVAECSASEETDCGAVSVSYWSIKKSTCP